MLFIDPIFLSDTKEALLAPQFNWGNSTTLYGGQNLTRLIAFQTQFWISYCSPQFV